MIAENLPDWSMRTASASFFVTFSSTHEPRSGMIQQLCSLRVSAALAWSKEKSTPGERWSCETITRSEPLMMNSPPPIMIGISPR